jgi:hypothetical protein
MRLAQDDELVHILAPDRSDKPSANFAKARLMLWACPGYPWCLCYLARMP